MKYQLVLTLIFLNGFISVAQDSEDIAVNNYVVDTTTYNGDTIVVFNDRSWEYISDYRTDYRVEVKYTNGLPVLDSAKITDYNWVTTKTHSLRYNLAGMTDSIRISLSGYTKPVNAPVNSGFKIRWGKWHKGHDRACSTGTPVVAAFDGVVRYSSYNHGGYGNLIIVRHYNGLETYYAHLSKRLYSENDQVKAGDTIGLVGSTGHSSGAHLHFECRFLENPFDPSLLEGNELIVHRGIFRSNPVASEKIALKKLFATTTEESLVKTAPTRRRRRKTLSNL